MSRKSVLMLAAGTLVGFPLFGRLMVWILGGSWGEVLGGSTENEWTQIAIGLGYGLTVAALGWQLVSRPFLKKTQDFFVQLIGSLNLSTTDIIFISLCAGIGEEVLFRGVVQHYLGIWPTSILFVLLHGYLNPRNVPLSVYGVYMVLVSSGLGYLNELVGLTSAAAAHTMIDIYLLLCLRKAHHSLP